jgi:hypothetical protein
MKLPLRAREFPYRQLHFEIHVHSVAQPFHNFLQSAAVRFQGGKLNVHRRRKLSFLCNSSTPGGSESGQQLASLDFSLDLPAGGHQSCVPGARRTVPKGFALND